MTRPKSRKRADNDALVTEALKGIANKQWKSSYAAAKALGIPRSTIHRRIQNGKSMAESRQAQQLLSGPEEKALKEWIVRLTVTGHPATHQFIKEMAEEIRKKRIAQINDEMELVSYDPIGSTWVRGFIKRHPQLETTLSKTIEAARVTTITKSAMSGFFDEYQTTLMDHDILACNTYNMDETGTLISMH